MGRVFPFDNKGLSKGKRPGPMEDPMSALAPYKLASIQVADEHQQVRYIAALLDGENPRQAARSAGSDELGIMLARHASVEFNDLCHLIALAKRENAVHETLAKSLAAAGTIHMVEVRNPDTGEVLLDDNFEPIRAPRLVNANGTVLAKLLDKVVEGADKPGPLAAIQINQTNNVGNELPAMPVLVIPGEE